MIIASLQECKNELRDLKLPLFKNKKRAKDLKFATDDILKEAVLAYFENK